MIFRFAKLLVIASATFLIACNMKEDSSKDASEMDWTTHQPIDDREFSFDEDSDSRRMVLAEDDIAQIERELRVEIPSFIKHWMVSNPVKDFFDDPQIYFVYRDYLIETYVRLRRDGYYGRVWPSDLLWISSDPGAGAYFVQSGSDRKMIYWFDWESGERGENEFVSIGKSESETPDEFLATLAEFHNDPDIFNDP